MANGKIAKRQEHLPANINFAADANIGLEKMTAQHLAIPFITFVLFLPSIE